MTVDANELIRLFVRTRDWTVWDVIAKQHPTLSRAARLIRSGKHWPYHDQSSAYTKWYWIGPVESSWPNRVQPPCVPPREASSVEAMHGINDTINVFCTAEEAYLALINTISPSEGE